MATMIDCSTFTREPNNDTTNHIYLSDYRIEWYDYHSDTVGVNAYLARAFSGSWTLHFTACNKLGTAGEIGVVGVANGHDSYEAASNIGPAIYIKYVTRTWYLVYRDVDEAETTDNTALLTDTYDYRPTFWTVTYTTGTGAIEAKVYSQADRTAATLIDTLTVAGEAAKTFTHIVAAMSNEADATVIGGYVSEIYIDETPPQVLVPVGNPAVVFDPDFYEDFAAFPTGDMGGTWTAIEEGAENYYGAAAAPDENDITAGFIIYDQITIGASDVLITHFRVYPRVAGTVKVGIYNDNGADAPSSAVVLANDSSHTLTTSTWNKVHINPTVLTAGTKYWIAAVGSATGTLRRKVSAGAQRAYEIADTLPGTATPSASDGYYTGMRACYYAAAAGNSLAKVDLSSDPAALPTGHTGTQYGIKIVTDEANQYAAGAEISFGTASTRYHNMASFWVRLASLGDGLEAQLFSIQWVDFEQVWGVGATIVRSGANYYWRLRGSDDVSTQTVFTATLDTWYHVTIEVKPSQNDGSGAVFAYMHVNGNMVDSITAKSAASVFTKITGMTIGYFGDLTTTKGGTYYIASYNVAGNLAGNGVLFGTTFFPGVCRGGASDGTLLMSHTVADTHLSAAGEGYAKIFLSTNNGAQDSWTFKQQLGPTADLAYGIGMRWDAVNNHFWVFSLKWTYSTEAETTDIWSLTADGATMGTGGNPEVADYAGWIAASRIFNSSNELLCGWEDWDAIANESSNIKYLRFEPTDDYTITVDSTITTTNGYYEPYLYLEDDLTVDDDLAVIVRETGGAPEHSHFTPGAPGTWSALPGSNNMGNITTSWDGLTGGLGAFRFRGKLYFQARMQWGNYTGMQALWSADPDSLDIISQYMIDAVGDADSKTTGALYHETGNGGLDASDYQGSGGFVLDLSFDNGIALFQQFKTGETSGPQGMSEIDGVSTASITEYEGTGWSALSEIDGIS